MIQFVQKYEFLILIGLAVVCYAFEWNETGLVLFLIAIVSLSMKSFMNKEKGDQSPK